MRRLEIENKIISSPKEIMQEQFKFYSDLYKSSDKVSFNLTNDSQVQLTAE